MNDVWVFSQPFAKIFVLLHCPKLQDFENYLNFQQKSSKFVFCCLTFISTMVQFDSLFVNPFVASNFAIIDDVTGPESEYRYFYRHLSVFIRSHHLRASSYFTLT